VTPKLRKHHSERTELAVSVPSELLDEASRRLGWLGLIYSGTYFLAHFGPLLTLTLGGGDTHRIGMQDAFAVAAIALGLVVFVVSRRDGIAPQKLLDWGLGFEVVGAFGIAINEFWEGFLPIPTPPFTGLPWECVWIVIFPLVAPNLPRKALLASLAAASTGPLTVVLAGAYAGATFIGEPVVFVTYFLFTNYLCAGLAYVVACIVHRYGVRLRHAREIGSYELVEKLGEGGMGEVWKARHRFLARPAAIKLIRSGLLGSNQRSQEAAVRRFEREARDTAALGSTHTVEIYDFGVDEDGSFYYVMELLEGLTLETFVRRFGPMDPARVVYLLRQVCHSLGEAHDRGLIHRDIKPANIFVCRLGPDYDFVKVLDFGLVKHRGSMAPGTMLTMEGTTAGTPSYMPPEMALGEQNIDGRADIYALGCVAYWLLTGQHVFAGETAMATILAHVREEPVPPSERSEIPIPPALDALVLACLAKDPAQRPATAAQLADRLSASVNGDQWTAETARNWWDLNRVTQEPSPLTVDADQSPVATIVPQSSAARAFHA
jgi:serine/threonine-protein kinase